jgi:hypothetical protein
MGIMLPDELIWIMDKLGFEWPDVDEDEVRRGADILRRFHDDVEAKVQAMDQKVNLELAEAMRGKAGPAYVAAWNTNRSQNLDKMLGLLGPIPMGMDVYSGVVTGLKVKCIADVTITLAQLVPLIAAGPFGAGGAALLIIAKKKALEFVTNVAVEEAMGAVLPLIIDPIVNQLPGVMAAVVDAPLVEAVADNPEEFYADLQALEAAEGDMEGHASDVESLVQNLMADLGGLNISGS